VTDETCRIYDIDDEPVVVHGGSELLPVEVQHLGALARTVRTRFTRDALKRTLTAIEQHDTNHVIRYGLVLDALAYAGHLGYVVGIALDPAEPAWPVVYIDLPTGQVSWHMPAYGGEYDGHTTPEKYQRIRDYLAQEAP
jgi:hypothetical protein